MRTNIDIRTFVQQYSSIPLERLKILQSLDDLDFSEIRRGIVFFFATWSGPCLLGFQRFTRTLKTFTEPIEVVVVDNDNVSESSAEKLFGRNGFKLGGWGEAIWIGNGQITARELTSSASEALIAEHTKVLLDEGGIQFPMMMSNLISLESGPERNVQITITTELLSSEIASPSGAINPREIESFEINRCKEGEGIRLLLWFHLSNGNRVLFYSTRSQFDLVLLLDQIDATIGSRRKVITS